MNINRRFVSHGAPVSIFPVHGGVPVAPAMIPWWARGMQGIGLLDPGSSCVPGANCPTGGTTSVPYAGVCTVGSIMAKYTPPPNISRTNFQPSTDANVFTTPSYIKELNWNAMLGTAIANNNLAQQALANDVSNFVANGCQGTPPNQPNYQNPQRSDYEAYYSALTNNGTGYNSSAVPQNYNLPGGVSVTNVYTPPSNAYGGVAVVPAPTTTPPPPGSTPGVNNNNTGGAPAGTGTGATGNGSNTNPVASNPFGFLTETSFGGLQNWMLIAGGLGALILLPTVLGRR